MSDDVRVAVVYHSGYGHTLKIAEAVGRGAERAEGAIVNLVAVEDVDQHWDVLDAADAIIMGAPTYMGSLSAQFKTFMDASSKIRYAQKRWDGKVAAGFTNGGSKGGDKQNSLIQLMTFAAQHQMHWVSLGLGYGNNRSNTTDEIMNRDTYSIGMAAQSNVNQASDIAPPDSDLRTAEFLGRRVADFTAVISAGRRSLGRSTQTGVPGGAEEQDPDRRGVTDG